MEMIRALDETLIFTQGKNNSRVLALGTTKEDIIKILSADQEIQEEEIQEAEAFEDETIEE